MSNPASDPSSVSPVLVEVADAVATVRLNRPEAMNSLDTATKVALRDALREVAADEAVRCVVLTGSGRAFCVGQDLKEHVQLLESGDEQALFSTVREHYNPIVTALATMPKPVLAAVNGVAAGAGASFAFACDMRIVADDAGFNLAFTGIGLSCDSGASWTLPRLVGQSKAIELLYEPRTLSASEAAELGLVDPGRACGRSRGRGRVSWQRGWPRAPPRPMAPYAGRWRTRPGTTWSRPSRSRPR